MARLRIPSIIKVGVLVLLAVNLLCVNIVIYRVYATLVDVTSARDLEEIARKYPIVQQLVNHSKLGGLEKLKEETLDRLFLLSHRIPEHSRGKDADISSAELISFIGVDVSHSGEASYIYRRIIQRKAFNYAKLVVDVGANDGFLSSNSYNFIEWGWDAILIEPVPSQMKMAKVNLAKIHDPYLDGKQQVYFVQGVLSDKDGFVDFVLPSDFVNMEGHIASGAQKYKEKTVKVRSYNVESLALRYQIPPKFAILSIDTEGSGRKIVLQWMKHGFQPAYIIYEIQHEKDPNGILQQIVNYGYKMIAKKGWNVILERRT